MNSSDTDANLANTIHGNIQLTPTANCLARRSLAKTLPAACPLVDTFFPLTSTTSPDSSLLRIRNFSCKFEPESAWIAFNVVLIAIWRSNLYCFNCKSQRNNNRRITRSFIIEFNCPPQSLQLLIYIAHL